ncbi:hypothetical protein HZA73_04590 [candidate division TA06 bacterium]|nr:hypothetical protein [candidate division TA06 bacterium]
MKKTLTCLTILTLFAAVAYATNTYKGFEKNEFAFNVKEVYDFRTETYYSASYAVSNKYEMGVGYAKNPGYDNSSNIFDSDINFHFFPKRKFDLYLGSGLSYYRVKGVGYSIDDTLHINPTIHNSDYIGGLLSFGINYWFIKNISLGVEIKNRFLSGLDKDNYSAKIMGCGFLGIKVAF